MKISSKQIIILSIVLVAAIIGYYFWTTSKPKYIDRYQQTINSAQNNIDSLKTEIVKSDIIIDNKNTVLKKKIITIKQEANEKINAVDKFTVSELNKFFTDRYSY